jgi:hypothetical protein
VLSRLILSYICPENDVASSLLAKVDSISVYV